MTPGSGIGGLVGEIRSSLGRLELKLDGLPTKADLLTMFVATFAALGLVMAGLAWLDDRANRSAEREAAHAVAAAPIVIQVPAPAQPHR